MSRQTRISKPTNNSTRVAQTGSSRTAGPAVAKEDVNVKNPGKHPREVPANEAKPKKKAGKRLMDYTG
jgi:hypothetical protein